MTGSPTEWIDVNGRSLHLRNRNLAALLAWLWPGAGHFYQRRYFKGWVLMVSILTTFLVGFGLGKGRVVYASWVDGDRRWQYGFQSLVGIPAFPAALQLMLMRQHLDRQGNSFGYEPPFDGLMAPPQRPVIEDRQDELAKWHAEAGSGFELGSWYTVIAGLLNLLAIFDAYGGPLDIAISGRKQSGKDEEDQEADEAKSGSKKKGTKV